ncbi:MAG: EAL domain-containing protein [Pseudomonadota bacterium]
MSAVGVIEISNPEELIGAHGAETFRLLHMEVVVRLRAWVRKQDQLLVDKSGRICVLLKGVTDTGQIRLAATKMLKLTAPPHEVFGVQLEVPILAGFAFAQGQTDTREAALARAGAALNQARRDQQAYAIYAREEKPLVQQEHELLASLREAVERGEFVLFFQPKVNAAFRNVVGAEALLRWLKDDKLLTPEHFIHVAERHDIIRPITTWVVKSAIARCARWQGDVGVSVNLPPTILQDDGLIHTVQDVLELQSVAPQRVTLEITESVMAQNFDAVLEQLSGLRELGLRISIDDFGTGYSSLAYFRDLPADEIKIDRCFVQNLLASKPDAAIVKSIIDLARNFGLNVVAEGVEDEATAAMLLDLGCDTLQGYLLDKPLPAEDLEKRHHLIS